MNFAPCFALSRLCRSWVQSKPDVRSKHYKQKEEGEGGYNLLTSVAGLLDPPHRVSQRKGPCSRAR